MDNRGVVLTYNLQALQLKILHKFIDEFNYEIVYLKDLNEIDNFKFMIAFIHVDNNIEVKKVAEITSRKYKGSAIVIDKVNNIFEKPKEVRLEILNAYQRYIKIEKATKPFPERLKRLVHMIRLFERHKILTMDQLIWVYSKNRRTLLRDLKLLKEVGVKIDYDKNKKAYILLEKYDP